LATPGCGTALGVIRVAHAQGKKIHVYVDETRPLLQGGRLTTYELEREKIPYTLICDNMAAVLMRQGKIQRVFVSETWLFLFFCLNLTNDCA
jgi:methylthioribose-1-phosphate isomerase